MQYDYIWPSFLLTLNSQTVTFIFVSSALSFPPKKDMDHGPKNVYGICTDLSARVYLPNMTWNWISVSVSPETLKLTFCHSQFYWRCYGSSQATCVCIRSWCLFILLLLKFALTSLLQDLIFFFFFPYIWNVLFAPTVILIFCQIYVNTVNLLIHLVKVVQRESM